MTDVTSHTGCVSRNPKVPGNTEGIIVTSHTGCVSRNYGWRRKENGYKSHIPHGMCE